MSGSPAVWRGLPVAGFREPAGSRRSRGGVEWQRVVNKCQVEVGALEGLAFWGFFWNSYFPLHFINNYLTKENRVCKYNVNTLHGRWNYN